VFFDVAESPAECSLGGNDSAGPCALLTFQLQLLILRLPQLGLGLLPLAVVQLVRLQRLHARQRTPNRRANSGLAYSHRLLCGRPD